MPDLRLSLLLISLSLLLLARDPAPARAAPNPLTEMAETALTAMNAEREAAGVAPLSPNPVVQAVAMTRATTLATTGVLSHTDPTGEDAATLLQAAGVWFSRVGENLGQGAAAGAAGVTALHTAWMESPAHRANILDPNFSQAGIGVVQVGGALVATVIFLD